MEQISFPWNGSSGGDGGTNTYTLDAVRFSNLFASGVDPSRSGVVYWTSNLILPFTSFTAASNGLLAPSNPSGGVVRIASGVGMVDGHFYVSDGDVDFDIDASPGAASATDLIVLEKDLSAGTVRPARVNGSAGATATVTRNNTVYQVKIAEVVLDGSGNLSSFTDVRKVAGNGRHLIEEIEFDNNAGFDFEDIPPIFSHLELVLDTTFSVTATELYRLNNDSGSNYDYARFTVVGGSTTATNAGGSTSFAPQPADGSELVSTMMRINNYASGINKSVMIERGYHRSGEFRANHMIGNYLSTSAVNRVAASGAVFVNGKAQLYGVA